MNYNNVISASQRLFHKVTSGIYVGVSYCQTIQPNFNYSTKTCITRRRGQISLGAPSSCSQVAFTLVSLFSNGIFDPLSLPLHSGFALELTKLSLAVSSPIFSLPRLTLTIVSLSFKLTTFSWFSLPEFLCSLFFNSVVTLTGV